MRKNAGSTFLVIALAASAGVIVACRGRAEGEISMEQAKAVTDVYLKARNEANLALLDGVYSPGVVVHDPSYPGPINGLAAIKAQYGNTHDAVPDVRFSMDDLYVKGDRLVWVFTMSGTLTGPFRTPLGEVPPSGKPFSFSGVSVDRIAAGRIVEEWVYFNLLEILQPMGFTLAPPGPPQSPRPEQALGAAKKR